MKYVFLNKDDTGWQSIQNKPCGISDEPYTVRLATVESQLKLLKRCERAGLVRMTGDDTMEIIERNLLHILLSGFLVSKLSQSKGNLSVDGILEFGKKNSQKIIPILKRKEDIFLCIFFFGYKHSLSYCSSVCIVAACAVSGDPELEAFFSELMDAAYQHEHNQLTDIAYTCFTDDDILQKITDLYGETDTYDLNFEIAAVFDYFLSGTKVEKADMIIGTVLVQNLFAKKEHLELLKGKMADSIRGSRRSKLITTLDLAKKYRKQRTDFADRLEHLYTVKSDRSDRAWLGFSYLLSNIDCKNFTDGHLCDIFSLASVTAGVIQEYFSFFKETILFDLAYSAPEVHTDGHENSTGKEGLCPVGMDMSTNRLKELEDKLCRLEKQNQQLCTELSKAEKKAAHYEAETMRLRDIPVGSRKEKNRKKDPSENCLDTKNITANENGPGSSAGRTTVPLKEAAAFLSSLRIVVVGGHPRWVQQMQQRFPGWIYVDNPNLPLPKAQYIDAIICNTDMQHSLYDKFMSFSQKANIPKYMLVGCNIEKVIMQLYDNFA